MDTKLLVNTTHAYTKNGTNTLATTPEVYDINEVLPMIIYLSFIQQLRVDTDITSHEPGKKAVDYLEGSLRGTLSNAEKDFDHHTKLLMASTETRAHGGGSNIYNTMMASLNKSVPETLSRIFNTRMHLCLVQQIRINTDITSHKLGEESLNYLDDVLHSALLGMGHRLEDLE